VDEMLGSGLRAVMMKVAGLGLKVEDVGKELGVMRPKLARLVSPSGFARVLRLKPGESAGVFVVC
jgi:diphthine-ammonia ligase